MIDAEFAVQFLVLAYAASYPGLQDNAGNIALMLQAQSAGLLPPGVGTAAADAYRELRHWQHQARLDEMGGRDGSGQLHPHRDAILQLWHAVFTGT
jgi:glutamate-ammonia-ligase adenylyltransferase